MENKEQKKGGIMTNLVAGVGGLIVVTLVIFVVVTTLLDANLFEDKVTNNVTINNEKGWGNSTGYFLGGTLGDINSSRSSYNITAAANWSDGLQINNPITNFTVHSNGTVINASEASWGNVTFNYSFTWTVSSDEQVVGDDMSLNFTEGVQNVSEKIPTILLIAAVVLLFGVIVLLVRQSNAMGVGTGASSL